MWTEELKVATQAIKQAQKEVLRYYTQDIEVKYKNHGDPITLADSKADEVLYDLIMNEFPEDGWLSEESTQDPLLALQEKRLWVVDPLDGTKDFIQKTGDFCISVALLVDSSPILGLIARPTDGRLYQAVYRKGATCNGEQIEVSSIKEHNEIKIAVSKTDNRRHMLEGSFPDWLKKNIVKVGSTALKIISVAEGLTEGFYCPWKRNIWDYCAAGLILEEAGGKITDLFGNAISWRELILPHILASNPHIHKNLLQILKRLV